MKLNTIENQQATDLVTNGTSVSRITHHASLRLFTQPEILKQIGHTRVAMFLNSSADELKETGIELPSADDDDPGYLGAIAGILADAEHLPEPLLRAALTLEAAASPECQ